MTRRQFARGVFGAALGIAAAGAVPASASPAGGRRVLLGAYVPDPYWDPVGWPAALARYDRAAGRRPLIVQWYVAWGGEQPFPTRAARLVRARGQAPMITWEPWDWKAGPVPVSYTHLRAHETDSY